MKSIPVIILLCCCLTVSGQNGQIDPTFNTVPHQTNTGPNGNILTAAIQSNGTIVIGGDFTAIHSTSRNRIARLIVNGTPDFLFSSSTSANGSVQAVAIQADGMILIGGAFTNVNGSVRNRIARLTYYGSLDFGFSIGSGFDGPVNAIIIQPDGKIVVAGAFANYNGATRLGIARLNSNGSLDVTFDPGSGPSNHIYCMALQPDGKILIGGEFTSYWGNNCSRVARLNADGSFDPTFNSTIGANQAVRCIALQSDSSVIIGGAFTTYQGNAAPRIARLTSSGNFDNSFNVGAGSNDIILSAIIQPDGKIAVAGHFTSFSDSLRNRIVRLNSNGSVDASFSFNGGANNIISCLALQTDGKIFMGGSFTQYDNYLRNYRNRVNSDGSLDLTYDLESGANNTISSIIPDASGKVVIGGYFTRFNSYICNYICRVNEDGTVDPTFKTGTGANSTIHSIIRQPDEKILIGGSFSAFNGVTVNKIARLNPDGTIDNTFNIGSGCDGTILKIILQPDGKILISGGFTLFNGIGKNNIARLNPNGSVDNTFDAIPGANSGITSMALKSDGRIYIGGSFANYMGVQRNYIARLNSDGSPDHSFNPGAGFNSAVIDMELQEDGRLLVSGYFNKYYGKWVNSMVRLEADGPMDSAFIPPYAPYIQKILPLKNGKIFIAGSFSAVNGNNSKDVVALLNSNGVADSNFNTSFLLNTANAAYFDENGYIVTAGDLANNTKRSIIRLFYDYILPTVPEAVCSGSTDSIYFNSSKLDTGNIFSAELSDANGSFVSPTIIGTLASDSSGGIPVSFPNVSAGTYKLRIVSSLPVVISDEFAISIDTSFTFPAGNIPLCGGDTIIITSTASDSYLWSTGSVANAITVTTPGMYSVTTACGTSAPVNVYSVQKPLISSVQPYFSEYGDTISISGSNFDSINIVNNIVYGGGQTAEVLEASATNLKATMQAGFWQGPVSVAIAGCGSNTLSEQFLMSTNSCGDTLVADSLFSSATTLATGSSPMGIALADFDDDGLPDLAVASVTNNIIRVYKNISGSSISFEDASIFPTGNGPVDIAVGDLNDDGKPDLACTNTNEHTVSILINNSVKGFINFKPTTGIAVLGGSPQGIGIADFDNDGRNDIAVSYFNLNTISLLRNNNAPGTFSVLNLTQTNFAAGTFPIRFALADIDADDKIDIAVSNEPASVGILKNTSTPGTISFSSLLTVPSAGTPYGGVTFCDLDLDGKLDLLNCNNNANSFSYRRNVSVAGVIDGSSFGPENTLATGISPSRITCADVNGDQRSDAIISQTSGISIFLNRSSGPGNIQFAPAVTLNGISNQLNLLAGDINTDGRPELIYPGGTSSNLYIRRNNIGVFTPFITSSDTSLCDGDTSVLIASAAQAYLWNTGDTVSLIIADSSGAYFAEATNHVGCIVATNTINLNFHPNPTAIINAAGSTMFCPGNSVLLNANNENKFKWSTGATTQTIQCETAGSYSVTVENIYACKTASQPVNITVKGNPQGVPKVISQKSLGGSGSDMHTCIYPTVDGGYIIGGTTPSNDGDILLNKGSNDCWIAKLDSSLNIQWQKTFGGTGNDLIGEIIPSVFGGYYVIGTTASNDGDFTGSLGSSDVFVLRLNSSGGIFWKRRLGGTLGENGVSIKQLSNGNLIGLATTQSNNINVSGNHGNNDFWLFSLSSSSGNVLWQRCFGGTASDEAFAFNIDRNGDFTIAGVSYSNDGNVSGQLGNGDCWIIKTNSSGTLLWQKCFGGSNFETAKSITQVNDGGYIFCGHSYSADSNLTSNAGLADAWIVKLSDTGVMEWQKSIGGSQLDYSSSVIQSPDGYYLMAGGSNSADGHMTGNLGLEDYYISKFDQFGNTVFTKMMGGADYERMDQFRILQKGDEMLFAGSSFSSDNDLTVNKGNSDFWIGKMKFIPVVNPELINNRCDSSSVILTSEPANQYLWNTGETTQAITASTTGTFLVTTDECHTSDTAFVNIYNSPPGFTNELYIEGLYGFGLLNGPLYNAGLSADPTDCDSVIIELHNASAPYNLYHSITALLKTDGTIQCELPCDVMMRSYYIVVRTRNGLETWSKVPVKFAHINQFSFK